MGKLYTIEETDQVGNTDAWVWDNLEDRAVQSPAGFTGRRLLTQSEKALFLMMEERGMAEVTSGAIRFLLTNVGTPDVGINVEAIEIHPERCAYCRAPERSYATHHVTFRVGVAPCTQMVGSMSTPICMSCLSRVMKQCEPYRV